MRTPFVTVDRASLEDELAELWPLIRAVQPGGFPNVLTKQHVLRYLQGKRLLLAIEAAHPEGQGRDHRWRAHLSVAHVTRPWMPSHRAKPAACTWLHYDPYGRENRDQVERRACWGRSGLLLACALTLETWGARPEEIMRDGWLAHPPRETDPYAQAKGELAPFYYEIDLVADFDIDALAPIGDPGLAPGLGGQAAPTGLAPELAGDRDDG